MAVPLESISNYAACITCRFSINPDKNNDSSSVYQVVVVKIEKMSAGVV